MKISNSKKQLAKIIHENGGWREGASFASQGRKTGAIGFVRTRPRRSGDVWQTVESALVAVIHPDVLIPNWHQTILSRDEYFYLHPVADAAPDADDGWIEWNGGDIDIDDMQLVDYKMACTPNGKYRTALSMNLFWCKVGEPQDIIAYRLHKPEQAKTEFCESVTRSIPEPKSKPTIEQLAADYRNAKDYADRKQQEADDAQAEVDAKLKALEIAGEAIGLIVSPITSKQDPELVIAAQVGDEVECVESNIKRDKYNGMVGRLRTIDESDTSTPYLVDFGGEANIWCHKVKFIRRP